MARPAIAIAPTPRPIKMLSTILYNDVATLAIIAGTEYCTNSLPMGFVPNVIGDEDCVCGISVNYKNGEYYLLKNTPSYIKEK